MANPKSAKNQIKKKIKIFILQNIEIVAKVLPKLFHLNGHTKGFRPQTEKLELNYMSPKLTLGVKGLIVFQLAFFLSRILSE